MWKFSKILSPSHPLSGNFSKKSELTKKEEDMRIQANSGSNAGKGQKDIWDHFKICNYLVLFNLAKKKKCNLLSQ